MFRYSESVFTACRHIDIHCLLLADVYIISIYNVHEHGCLIILSKHTGSKPLFKQSSIRYCHNTFRSVHWQHEPSPCYAVCCLLSVQS